MCVSVREFVFLLRAGESKSIGSLVPAPFRLEGSSGRLVTAALMTQYKHHRFRLELQAKEAASPYRIATTSVHVSGGREGVMLHHCSVRVWKITFFCELIDEKFIKY